MDGVWEVGQCGSESGMGLVINYWDNFFGAGKNEGRN